MPRHSINDKKTPSKSPYTKKVRKCLEDELFDYPSVETTHSILNPEPPLDQPLCTDSSMEDIQNLIPAVLKNLAEVGCDETFVEFLNQVNNGEFPLQNISFLLWMEVVKWFSCDNTCRMRYSNATKTFWKLGYRVFGGRFIHFMGGYKYSESPEDRFDKGFYSPHISDINFAVPDMKILRSFMPYDIPCVVDNSREPGILPDMIESMSKAMNGKPCCVTFDGKKLKQGLTKDGGDIDILGFEKGDSIADKRKTLDDLLKPVVDTIDNLSKFEESLDIRTLTTPEKTKLKECLFSGMKAASSEVLEIKAMRTD